MTTQSLPKRQSVDRRTERLRKLPIHPSTALSPARAALETILQYLAQATARQFRMPKAGATRLSLLQQRSKIRNGVFSVSVLEEAARTSHLRTVQANSRLWSGLFNRTV